MFWTLKVYYYDLGYHSSQILVKPRHTCFVTPVSGQLCSGSVLMSKPEAQLPLCRGPCGALGFFFASSEVHIEELPYRCFHGAFGSGAKGSEVNDP